MKYPLLLAAALLLTGQVEAESRTKAPQAAYDACQKASVGAGCSFAGRRGDTLRGTCDNPDGRMLCIPANRPDDAPDDGPMGNEDGERRGPPREATAACKDNKTGDACGFTGKRGEQLKGTCRTIESQLACVPRGGRPGNEGNDERRSKGGG